MSWVLISRSLQSTYPGEGVKWVALVYHWHPFSTKAIFTARRVHYFWRCTYFIKNFFFKNWFMFAVDSINWIIFGHLPQTEVSSWSQQLLWHTFMRARVQPQTVEFLLVCLKSAFPVSRSWLSALKFRRKLQCLHEPNLLQAYSYSFSIWDFPSKGFITFHNFVLFCCCCIICVLISFPFGNLI